MTTSALPWRHMLLVLAVMAVWGANFVVIKVALTHLPPLLLATLRFTFAQLPAVFFLKRPKVAWSNLAAYGVLIGAVQFGLLFIALNGRISPGLASLVVQSQVFFTIGLSVALTGERVRPYQYAALALATAGIAVILWHSDTTTTPLGLALTIAAAMGWAGGNAVLKSAGAVNVLAYVVWASLFSIPPLLILTLVFDGPAAIGDALARADAATWAAVAYQSVGNTLFGYAAWGWLLSRHPAATITPAAMLVPVIGVSASAWWLGEPLEPWKLEAGALVMAGLALNMLWPAIAARK